MITIKEVEDAYSNTLQAANRISIGDCFSDGGRVANEIIRYMRLNGSPFGTVPHSELGFPILYKMGDFEVIVKYISFDEDLPFCSVESFVDWLEEKELMIRSDGYNLTH